MDDYFDDDYFEDEFDDGLDDGFEMIHFGHFPIGEITEHEILVFRKVLEQKGLKESSINDKIMKPLCMSLFRAYKRGLIDNYPCESIKRLSEQKPDIDPFSFDELIKFLDFLKAKKPEYYEMIFIWSRTGLMDSYIFMTHANKPFSDAFMRKKFRHLLRITRLKYRPPKQMRHTFATLHIAAGENLTWVSEMLGHASVEITMKRYNRFIPNLTREDGSAFEQIIKERKKEKAKKALGLEE